MAQAFLFHRLSQPSQSQSSNSVIKDNNFPLQQTTNKIPPLPTPTGGYIEKFENPKPDQQGDEKENQHEYEQVKVNKKSKKDKAINSQDINHNIEKEEGGFMSYYMNWINVFAIIFIAIYWIIEKFT